MEASFFVYASFVYARSTELQASILEKPMRIKICGITQPEQGRAIAQMGATALGFICAPTSARYITPEQIAAVTEALGGLEVSPDRIGVFVNAGLNQIAHTVERGGLTGVQLHGEESPAVCRSLRQLLPSVELIKALRIRESEDLQQAQSYGEVVDTLLLDAYHPTLGGGTGHTLDWQSLAAFRPSLPWILAGGLTPANVGQALMQLRPQGIDLSSGVEVAPGRKDLAKVEALMQAVQSHRDSP
jgi:phosphoribosylanthranilate isomerase